MVRFACAINKASGKYAEMRRTMSQKKTFVTLEQLKEINDAFEAGVNLHPYIRKSVHGVQLHEIILGLQKNLNVAGYADPE